MTWNRRDFLERVERAATLDGLQQLIVELRDAWGVDNAVYHWVSSDAGQFGVGTYSPDWVWRYLQQGYLSVDPVITGAFSHAGAVDWRDLDWSGKTAREMLGDAIAHGVGRQGVSQPLRGPNGQFAILSLSDHRDDSAWDVVVRDRTEDLLVVGDAFNRTSITMRGDRVSDPAKRLSKREIDVLSLLAAGYARAKVSQMLAISEHTVRAYIESARLKLAATNTIHAVARAITEGFIVAGTTARGADGEFPPDDVLNDAQDGVADPGDGRVQRA